MFNKLNFTILLLVFNSARALFSEGSISPRDSTLTYSTSTYSSTLDFCTAFRNTCINVVGALNYHHQLDCVTSQSGPTILAFCGGILKTSSGDTGDGPTIDFTTGICPSQLSGCTISAPPTQPVSPFDGNTNSPTTSSTSTTTSSSSTSSSTVTTTVTTPLANAKGQATGSSTSTVTSTGAQTSTATILIFTPTSTTSSSTSTSSRSLSTLALITSTLSPSDSSASTSSATTTTSSGSVGYLSPMAGTAIVPQSTSESGIGGTITNSGNSLDSLRGINLGSIFVILGMVFGVIV